MAADFTSGQAARAVIGQDTFTASKPGGTNWRLGAVSGLAYTNGTLIVADSNRIGASPIDNRVLIYRNIASDFPPQTQEHDQRHRCPACGGAADVALGQPDFTTTDAAATQTGMSLPTAVATDGTVLVVADTLNNRVLIWKTIPGTNNKPADIVVGQPDFTTTATSVPPTAKSMRGPQGVWIQGGKLYVADTQDHRVLIYNSIPRSNGAAADLVLGQPNFTTFVEPDLTQAKSDATANNLLNPVSVTSDGVRLYITDLGHNRVLIWNSIPTQNQQPADVVVGQPDMTSSLPNNAFTGIPATDSTDTTHKETPVMCTVSNGTDGNNNPTYPLLCASTMSFPRYVLSDGNWLFVADGGNDRVLVYKTIPTTNGAAADLALGQADLISDVASPDTDRLQTPTSLAWDGENLYVADTYNRRVVIYSPAEPSITVPQGVLNFASLEVFALGVVTFGGTNNEKDEVTVTIGGTPYKYTVVKNDTFDNVVNSLVNSINTANSGKGDPNVFAAPNTVTQSIVLTAKKGGTDGNGVTLAASVSSSAKITATASGANLSGGQNTAQVGPGTLITIYGKNLSDSTASEPGGGPGTYLPNELAGTRVYIDGARAPLLFVSPTQINTRIPPGVADATSVSLYVWTQHKDGTVTVTTPVSVTIVPENPGIFATGTKEPRAAVMSHASPYATGSVSVDGTVNAGDVGTIKIGSTSYTYTVVSTDTLDTITSNLVTAINKDTQGPATATSAGVFTRVLLQARKKGKPGEGITYSATVSSGAKLLLTPSGSALCCDNTGLVTAKNPAVPGEQIIIMATGLGLAVDAAPNRVPAGQRYPKNIATTQPVDFVSSLAGGKTANVLEATPLPGFVGVWQVLLELNSGLTTEPLTQLTIAQSIYVSNIVTFPVTGVVSTPVASPGAGSYSSAQSVTLTATNSTSIYYTTDGSTPTCSGTGKLYSGAISVSGTETIKAIGCQANWDDSPVLTAAYTIT